MLFMAHVYLLLGGNESDKFFFLNKAAELIHRNIGKIINSSSYYETEAWGFDANSFLNQVLMIDTHLNPDELLKSTQHIECKLGRIRQANHSPGYQSRNIDIDILFYEDKVVSEPHLTIPHAYIHERRFTLEPLHEIAPEMVHPVMGQTIQELRCKCTDKKHVKKLVKCKM